MGTRSSIGILNPDGSVEAVYCRWDGYLGHNGRILLEHYRTGWDVWALIARGGISSLGEKIGLQHSFEEGPEGECTFYHRDRGDALQVGHYATIDEWIAQGGQEYDYLFDPSTQEWKVRYGFDHNHTLRSLAERLEHDADG